MASGTSKKTELTLLGVARASLEEALQDAEDYIRQHQLQVWSKTDPRSQEIRNLLPTVFFVSLIKQTICWTGRFKL